MNSDQIKELIAGLMAPITEMMKTMQGAQSSSEKDLSEEAANKKNKDHDSRLNEKSYKRMEKFTSGESEWDEWKYDFLIITRSVNPEVGDALAKIIDGRKSENALAMKGAMDNKRYAGDFTPNPWDPVKRSKELFELLIMLTAGEAKSLIKTETEDGFVAWHILNNTYSRRTLAKTLRYYRESSNPEKAQHLRSRVGKRKSTLSIKSLVNRWTLCSGWRH